MSPRSGMSAALALMFVMILPAPLAALGELVPAGSTGTGIQLSSGWEGLTPHDLGIQTTFTISGVFDFGIGLGATFGTLGGASSVAVNPSVAIGLVVLKEQEAVPVTVTVSGSYGVETLLSDYLTTNNLIESGTGYSFDVRISRMFPLNPELRIFAALDGAYGSVTRITSSGSLTSVITRPISFTGTLTAGLLMVNRKKAMYCFFLEGSVDSGFAWRFGPRLALLAF